jgi:hypothetical protein
MINQIHDAILDAYGSTDTPKWDFVQKRIHEKIYEEIAGIFLNFSNLLETTDINEDCARIFYLEQNNKQFSVCLSLVGKFACIYDANGKFFNQINLSNNSFGSQILKVLNDAEIMILSEECLRKPMVFEHEPKLLYEILFSSDELLK